MKKSIFILSVCFLLQACSLKYDSTVVVEDKTPQFVFSNVEMTRYEQKEKKISFNADLIEQYKGSDVSYIKGVSFQAFDKNELSTEGECGYLMLDSNREIYELYDSIKLFSKSKNFTVFADSLRWNGKNEQLVSGRGSNVRVEKEDLSIIGSGFSASGVSDSFSFTGIVSGEINTK